MTHVCDNLGSLFTPEFSQSSSGLDFGGNVTALDPLVKNIISACWSVFLVVWLLAAIFTKRTVYRESRAQRLRYTIPILIGCYLLFRGFRLPYPFNIRLIPHTNLILGAAGMLLASKSLPDLLPYVLAFAAGNFLYVAMSDLIPDLHRGGLEGGPLRQLFLIGAGILTIVAL